MTDRQPASYREDQVVLEVEHLSVAYGSGAQALCAVDDVSFRLHRGEILGIAGESGSGKSTLAFAMTRLLRPPGRIVEGDLRYHAPDGRIIDILELSDAELRRFRWEELAIVFQSAMNALNPVFTLRTQLRDVLRAHRPELDRAECDRRTAELLVLVGLPPERMHAYPHELSGGMRQRAMIALALALDPDIIVMDEPTTALDVVMQRQILDEIGRLRRELSFAVVFITHDLSLLLEVADTIVVMYGGRLVETATTADLYHRPCHPYSQGLLNSFPLLSGPKRELAGIPGSPPDLRIPIPGCPFAPRCPSRMDVCDTERPRLAPPSRASHGQEVACHLYPVADEAASSNAVPAVKAER